MKTGTKNAQEDSKVLRIGGTAGFDFINTNYLLGSRIEILEDPQALLSWMVGAKLLTDKDLKTIREQFSAKDLNRLLDASLELRDRLRNILKTFTEKGPARISKEDIHYLNNILHKGSSHLRVEIQAKENLLLCRVNEWDNIEEVLALIVESVVTTLTTEKSELIKKCSHGPCNLYFLDETKAHSRHYCSQAICGNRAKQAAFRKRQKNK